MQIWITDNDQQFIGRFDVQQGLRDYLRDSGGHVSLMIRPRMSLDAVDAGKEFVAKILVLTYRPVKKDGEWHEALQLSGDIETARKACNGALLQSAAAVSERMRFTPR